MPAFLFTNESVNILNDAIDSTFRQMGIAPLTDVNDLVRDFQTNVVSTDESNNQTVTLTDKSVETIKKSADIHLRFKGLEVSDDVIKLMEIIRNPVTLPVSETKSEVIDEIQNADGSSEYRI